MRVCFIIGTLEFSGAEKVLKALATHFTGLGHDVHVVLTLPEQGSAKAWPFRVHHVTASGLRPIRIYRRLRGIRTTVASISPDVTISFGYANNINSTPALLFNGVPHIVCERNNPLHDPPGWRPKLLRRALYPLATGMVFQTEAIRDLFPSSIVARSATIPNPVIGAPAQSASPGATCRKGGRMVCIGRLSDRDKNQSLLIRAFARLAHDYPDWTLELYGDGPDRSLFEQLIAELGMPNRIRLCGRIANPYSALEGADLFVLPSRTEGMPNALIEAMASGVACVATNCSGGGAAALITHGANGLICANEDEEAMAASLRTVMQDPELRRSLGEAARAICESQSIERIGQQWSDYIHLCQVATRAHK